MTLSALFIMNKLDAILFSILKKRLTHGESVSDVFIVTRYMKFHIECQHLRIS